MSTKQEGRHIPRVLAICELPKEAMELLRDCERRGILHFDAFEPWFMDADGISERLIPLLPMYDAVICRPARGGHLTQEMLSNVRDDFIVATCSRGIDHIAVPERKRIRIIAATGPANAGAVAELAIYLALELLRKTAEARDHVKKGNFSNTGLENARSFQGLTWTIIGAGHQARELCGRLAPCGLKEVIVYHPEMDQARLQRLKVPGLCLLPENDLGRAVSGADVISIHTPLTREADRRGRPSTAGMFNESVLDRMKPTAVIINVARGDLINEDDMLAALQNRRIGGYGTDVLNAKAENSSDPEDSPLWMVFIREESLPLAILPHIGGSVAQAEAAIARQVVEELLDVLLPSRNARPAVPMTPAVETLVPDRPACCYCVHFGAEAPHPHCARGGCAPGEQRTETPSSRGTVCQAFECSENSHLSEASLDDFEQHRGHLKRGVLYGCVRGALVEHASHKAAR